MPAETSIPCSKRARDLVRDAKGDLSYTEWILRQMRSQSDSEEN